MIALLFFLQAALAAPTEPPPFPIARKCGEAYWPAMREVDLCIGGRPKPECPAGLKKDELMWALPAINGNVVMIKTSGDMINAIGPQPAFRIEKDCYRIKSQSFYPDRIEKTACPKSLHAHAKTEVTDRRVSADFINRIAVDLEGLANEFESYPPHDEVSEANNRFTRYLAFNPDACKKAVEALKGSSDPQLGPAIAGLEAQLKRWDALKTASLAQSGAGGTKKRDGKD